MTTTDTSGTTTTVGMGDREVLACIIDRVTKSCYEITEQAVDAILAAGFGRMNATDKPSGSHEGVVGIQIELIGRISGALFAHGEDALHDELAVTIRAIAPQQQQTKESRRDEKAGGGG